MSSATTPNQSASELPVEKVPTRQRFFWGLGGVADQLINCLSGLMDSIYINAMGLDPKIIGLARSLPRLLDLVTDPIIGHLSDNTRSRWGRRKPWMVAGAILSAVIGILMWHPPLGAGSWVSTTFVVGASILLVTFAYSMFMIPYTAQGYELSTDYNERTHIFQWRLYAFSAIGFFSPWIYPLCLWVEGDAAKVTRGSDGIHWVSCGIAFVILVCVLGPILGCKERGKHIAEKKTKILESIRFTLKNRAFWPLVAGNFFVRFGLAVTGSFFFYIMVYSVAAGNTKIGAVKLAMFINVVNVATFIGAYLIGRYADWVGKKTAILSLMLLSAVAYASTWLTMRPQHAEWSLAVTRFLHTNIGLPSIVAESWPVFLTAIGIGLFTNSMPVVMNSMLADVCDVDELSCGQQRQAFYGAVFVTCEKLAASVAWLLGGFLLSVSGYSAKLAEQSPETLSYWLKALLLSQPVGFIFGFLCVLAYPITRAKAKEVRRLLDARKAAGTLSP